MSRYKREPDREKERGREKKRTVSLCTPGRVQINYVQLSIAQAKMADLWRLSHREMRERERERERPSSAAACCWVADIDGTPRQTKLHLSGAQRTIKLWGNEFHRLLL